MLEENKVLSKVMEKITSEYDELKKVKLEFFKIIFSPGTGSSESGYTQVYEGMKCPKDDKIQALRSTAR